MRFAPKVFKTPQNRTLIKILTGLRSCDRERAVRYFHPRLEMDQNHLLNAQRTNQTMMECFRDISKWLQETKASPPAVAVRRESNEQLRQRANQLYTGKKFDAAIDVYGELLSRNIDESLRSVILSNRAQSYLMLGKYRKCIDDASESLERRPTDKTYFRRAMAHFGLGNHEDAERDLVACRQIVANSDLTTRQMVDEKLDQVRRAHVRTLEEKDNQARRVLCSCNPGWTFGIPESEFKDVQIQGINAIEIKQEVTTLREFKQPVDRYIPRCQRTVRSYTVN